MDNIILASGSPRRKQLLSQAGYTFRVVAADVDETFPEDMNPEDVPAFLAEKKAAAVSLMHPDAVIIAADTIVVLDRTILGKPSGPEDAVRILKLLSGKPHKVITGVCILGKAKKQVFSETTRVFFRDLTEADIMYYVSEFKPMDKAGAYAIQEWIGLIGIEKIEGDYYNVVGLPAGAVVRGLRSLL